MIGLISLIKTPNFEFLWVLMLFLDMIDQTIKPQNLCPWLVKSSQSNLNLCSPGCYWVRSYLITYYCTTFYRWMIQNNEYKPGSIVSIWWRNKILWRQEKLKLFPFIMTTLGALNDDSSLLKGGRRGRLYKSSASGLSH